MHQHLPIGNWSDDVIYWYTFVDNNNDNNNNNDNSSNCDSNNSCGSGSGTGDSSLTDNSGSTPANPNVTDADLQVLYDDLIEALT